MRRQYPNYYHLDPTIYRETPELRFEPSHQQAYRNMDASVKKAPEKKDVKKFFQSSSDDRVYYNIVIPFDQNNTMGTMGSPAIYQEQLNQPIIFNPSDYYLAIQRFSIPTGNVPIFIPEIQPFPNTDLDKTIYSVTLSYGGVPYQQFVEFSSTSPKAPMSLPLTALHPYADKTPYYYVFSYQVFLTMINEALATAFTQLGMLTGLPNNSLAPFFIFDPSTQKISLIAQGDFYLETVATPIEIYVNTPLFTFVSGIPNEFYGNFLPNGEDYLLLVSNFYNNNGLVNYPPYNIPVPAPIGTFHPIIMTQEYSTLVNWNSFQTLELTTNLIPIKQEFLPAVTDAGTATGVLNSIPILKDFVPLVDTLEPAARTTVNFSADGPYQLINLTSTQPLSKFDMTVYWTDQFQNKYILDIPFNQNVTIKLVFIKKSSYNAGDNKTI